MVRVTLEGWRPGLNKVELNHLLRREAGFGLADAKDAVDRLLDGGRVTFDATDRESAQAFCVSAGAVGVLRPMVTEESSKPTLAER